MTTFLSIGNQVTITCKFLDANDYVLFGFGDEIVWTNDSPTTVRMQTANDNVSAFITGVSPGTANITATLGTLTLTNEFTVSAPISGYFVIGQPSGANSIIGRV